MTADTGAADKITDRSIEVHDRRHTVVSGTRVVYVAMKPQLRGRIRRNVSTLLELGAHVTVLTVRTNADFYVGLDHPQLEAEYLEARSLYVRFATFTSASVARKAARRSARIDRRHDQRSTQLRSARPLLYAAAAVLLIAVRAGAALHGALSWLGRTIIDGAQHVWRQLSPRLRHWGWMFARWQVRTRRKIARSWDRAIRRLETLLPRRARVAAVDRRRRRSRRRAIARQRTLATRAMVRRHRRIRRALLNRRLSIRRGFVRRGKDLLRPWHRTTRFFAFWTESARRAEALSPDLIMSSDLPGLVGASRAARRLGIPHVHDCHELYLESTSFRAVEKRVLAPFERYHLRRAQSVIAVNQSIATEYRQRYGREPVVVRNCAARLQPSLVTRDLRVAAGLSDDALVVLYQGGFSAGRGLDVCIAAMAALPDHVHLILLGFGPLVADLHDLAAQTSVAPQFHVLDAVPPEELAAWTASADVGLIPYQPVSMNNMLALPNKVFEYTAVGVPIVAADLPELRRVAVGAGCGAVYDAFDPESLAAALSVVLDPDHHVGYRDAARRYGEINVWENEQQILIKEIRDATEPSILRARSHVGV